MKYKVYCTYLDNGKYYIGYSGKNEEDFDAYFGSRDYVINYEGRKIKEIIFETDSQKEALWVEFFLQMQSVRDFRCLNQRLFIDTTKDYIIDFFDELDTIDWQPDFTLLDQ